jgi:hypothetical protein
MVIRNLFSGIPESTVDEIIEPFLKTDHFKLERIISQGQKTPPGEWYDQDTNEWVILLCGSAGLLFEGETNVRIPTQIGHPFRSKPATYSVPIRPVIPKQTGHPLTKVSDAG